MDDHLRLRRGFLACLISVSLHLVSSSNATNIPRDASPPVPLPTGCLNNSFIAPTWTVESFSYSTNQRLATVNFILASNTINVKLECFSSANGREQDITGDCINKDNEYQSSTSFNFRASTNDLTVRQEWTCDGDAGITPIRFAGTNTQNLVLSCESNTCTSANSIRIPIKLLEPLELAPYIPPGPPGHATPGCMHESESPSWSISDFQWRTGGFNYTWTSWLSNGTAIGGAGSLRLNITNSATQHTFSCIIRGVGHEVANVTIIDPPGLLPVPTDPGEVWFPCNTHSLNENGEYTHNYEVETMVRLIGQEKRLLMNQTWYCDDESPASPAKFYAVGEAKLPSLECSERPEIEPSETDLITIPAGSPLVNGSTCMSSNFDITGKVKSRYAMEPYALDLPNPEVSKCTVISFTPFLQTFYLDTEYYYTVPMWWYYWQGEPKAGLEEFYIRNLAIDNTFGCAGETPKLNPNGTEWDPTVWLNCSRSTVDPVAYKWLGVNYNPELDTVSVGMAWSCDELSPGHPITFTAFGETNTMKLVCDNDSNGLAMCKFPKMGDIPVQFTNITWDTA
ncbi:hypothetical protein F4777DRAFT_574083 [Nemania sp. FL0916]|nr:hypothetical protein F4777DRAFT_574083 [Nemania sp. FL0916]